MIEGGWDYVAAAYSITYAALFLYSVNVWRRARHIEQHTAKSPDASIKV